MRIPGFTASASLGRAGRAYRSVTARRSGPPWRVLPQQAIDGEAEVDAAIEDDAEDLSAGADEAEVEEENGDAGATAPADVSAS